MWDAGRHTCGEEDCEVAEGPEIMRVYGWHGGGCGCGRWRRCVYEIEKCKSSEVYECKAEARGRRYVTALCPLRNIPAATLLTQTPRNAGEH